MEKLTAKEVKFLNAMRRNEYNDCLSGYDGTNWNDPLVGECTWTFTAMDYSGLTQKQCTGVMSSLTKKGLIGSEQVSSKIFGDEDTVWFTEKGAKLFIDATGEKCPWGGFRLLKEIEEKTVAPDYTVVDVEMYTFTGMKIQHVRQAELENGVYLVNTKKGFLKFDAKTLTQIDCKNPKFANKIKIL